jgi:D-ribose pyranase
VPVEQIPHSEFKERSVKSRAIIRTGEFTPYANVILVSGPWGFDL